MSRQVDKKIDNLDKKFAKVLEITGFEQAEFAIECKINPGTLSKALERSSLSKDIVKKIYDRFGVRKDYWSDGREPIVDKNHTPAIKSHEAAVTEERKLIATLEQTVAIIEKDNDNLWKQNATLIALVEKLSLTRANEN